MSRQLQVEQSAYQLGLFPRSLVVLGTLYLVVSLHGNGRSKTPPSRFGSAIVSSSQQMFLLDQCLSEDIQEAKTFCCSFEEFPVLGGVDVVDLFFRQDSSQPPSFGSPSITALLPTREGTYTFYFLTEENRAEFLNSPWHYAPAYGGFDAHGFTNNLAFTRSSGKKELGPAVDLSAWAIYNDRLFFFGSASTRQDFLTLNAEDTVSIADDRWSQMYTGKLYDGHFDTNCFRSAGPAAAVAAAAGVGEQPRLRGAPPTTAEEVGGEVGAFRRDYVLPAKLAFMDAHVVQKVVDLQGRRSVQVDGFPVIDNKYGRSMVQSASGGMQQGSGGGMQQGAGGGMQQGAGGGMQQGAGGGMQQGAGGGMQQGGGGAGAGMQQGGGGAGMQLSASVASNQQGTGAAAGGMQQQSGAGMQQVASGGMELGARIAAGNLQGAGAGGMQQGAAGMQQGAAGMQQGAGGGAAAGLQQGTTAGGMQQGGSGAAGMQQGAGGGGAGMQQGGGGAAGMQQAAGGGAGMQQGAGATGMQQQGGAGMGSGGTAGMQQGAGAGGMQQGAGATGMQQQGGAGMGSGGTGGAGMQQGAAAGGMQQAAAGGAGMQQGAAAGGMQQAAAGGAGMQQGAAAGGMQQAAAGGAGMQQGAAAGGMQQAAAGGAGMQQGAAAGGMQQAAAGGAGMQQGAAAGGMQQAAAGGAGMQQGAAAGGMQQAAAGGAGMQQGAAAGGMQQGAGGAGGMQQGIGATGNQQQGAGGMQQQGGGRQQGSSRDGVMMMNLRVLDDEDDFVPPGAGGGGMQGMVDTMMSMNFVGMGIEEIEFFRKDYVIPGKIAFLNKHIIEKNDVQHRKITEIDGFPVIDNEYARRLPGFGTSSMEALGTGRLVASSVAGSMMSAAAPATAAAAAEKSEPSDLEPETSAEGKHEPIFLLAAGLQAASPNQLDLNSVEPQELVVLESPQEQEPEELVAPESPQEQQESNKDIFSNDVKDQEAIALELEAKAVAERMAKKKNKIDKTCTKVLEGVPDAKDFPARLPPNFEKVTVNLWDHPDAKRLLAGLSEEAVKACVTENNLDFFYNKGLQQNDLLNFEQQKGYTVMNLDCRDTQGDTLAALLLVLDDAGAVAALSPLERRAESVNLRAPGEVLFATGHNGAGVWRWREGAAAVERLPLETDSHTLWYSAAHEAYFGMEPPSKVQKNAPSVASAWSPAGEQLFSFVQDKAHINYITVDDDAMYVSLRASAALEKVDLATSEVEWVLGGTHSTFTITDAEGNEYAPTGEDTWRDGFGSWHHQHKFQHLDATHFSLFDNHVDEQKSFIDDEVSRMVVLEIDEEAKTAREIFAFKTGDQAMIYGGADVLPSGNVVGSSYPDFVYPALADQSYQQNLWEVTPEGEVAWRVGVRGPNPWAPEDADGAPFSHRIDVCEEAPVGWVVFNVERFYERPPVSRPCATAGGAVRFLAFNTLRTQGDGQGVAFLYDAVAKATAATQVFTFQKSWLPRAVELQVPEGPARDAPLSLVVVNAWKESATHSIGAFSDLPRCEEVPRGNRIIAEEEGA